jgi:hypothetical protein
MKIAVLITGAPRTILQCIPSIKSLIDGKHTIDYFLHTWNDNLTNETKYEIVSQLNPIVYRFPEFMTWDSARDNVSHLCNGTNDLRTIFSKAWSNYAANLMRLEFERQAKVKYDAVAFMRTDVKYDISQFDPEPYLQEPKKVIQSIHHNFGMWSDQFMIGLDQAATHYASVVLWMLGHMPRLEAGTYPFGGEVNTKTWMEQCGNYSRHLVDIPHHIVR